MSVYFVYRSHYEGPSGKHVRVLDGESVLGWFQVVWERAKEAEDVAEWVKAELGMQGLRLASIFEAARDESLPPPKTDRKLKSYLEEHLYVEGEILFEPHAMQVLTDDDEIELAYFFFDDHYLKAIRAGPPTCSTGTGSYRPRAETVSYEPSITTKEVLPAGEAAGGDLPGLPRLLGLAATSPTSTWMGRAGSRASGCPQLGEYLRDAAPDRGLATGVEIAPLAASPRRPAEASRGHSERVVPIPDPRASSDG